MAPHCGIMECKSATRAFPVRGADAAGRIIIIEARPCHVNRTVPADASSGGAREYRDRQRSSEIQSTFVYVRRGGAATQTNRKNERLGVE